MADLTETTGACGCECPRGCRSGSGDGPCCRQCCCDGALSPKLTGSDGGPLAERLGS